MGGVQLEDALDHLQRAGEVAQREQLAGALHPDLDLALLGAAGVRAPGRSAAPAARMLGLLVDAREVEPVALGEDDRRRLGGSLSQGDGAYSRERVDASGTRRRQRTGRGSEQQAATADGSVGAERAWRWAAA